MSPLKSIGYHNSQGNNRDTRVCVRARVSKNRETLNRNLLFLIVYHEPRFDYAEATPPEYTADICQMSKFF